MTEVVGGDDDVVGENVENGDSLKVVKGSKSRLSLHSVADMPVLSGVGKRHSFQTHTHTHGTPSN